MARKQGEWQAMARLLVAEGFSQQAVADALGCKQPSVTRAVRGLCTRAPGVGAPLDHGALLDDVLFQVGAARVLGDDCPANATDVLDALHRKWPDTRSVRKRAVACALALRRARELAS